MSFRLIIFLLLTLLSTQTMAGALDSLRIEKVKGKKHIIHRVEPKETLYAIARRYHTSVEELHTLNPSLKEGLKMYDELQIPLVKRKKTNENTDANTPGKQHIVQQGETMFAISRQYGIAVDSLVRWNQLENFNISIGDTLNLESRTPTSSIKATKTPQKDSTKIHIVQPSETLFGISRQYQVEIEDLQQWNQLKDYTLAIGQKLWLEPTDAKVAGAETTTPKKEVPPTQPEEPKNTGLDTLYVKTDNSQFKTKTQEVAGKKETQEEGFAMKIENTDYTSKYLALHRTAPLGSVIQVRNEMNNKTIVARVVGRLPESATNNSLLIRLSSAAYKALGAIDLKTPVIARYINKDE